MMSLSELVFLVIVFYLLYKFVFNLFLPIFRTTKEVKQQFRNMRDAMQDQANNPFQQRTAAPQNAPQQPKKPEPTRSSNTMGEYIDFEEIK